MSIIEFSVENFKIFRKKVTFSMWARKSDHTFKNNGENLLKTSLIYGPNASGKSSLFEAIGALKMGITNSAKNPEGSSSFLYRPFVLSDNNNQPVFYETVFSLENKIFRYNFSIFKNEIVTENLFEVVSDDEEKKYLIRDKQKIDLFNDFKKSEDIKAKTRKEVLFLSAAAQWNDELAMKIEEGFKRMNIITGPIGGYESYTIGFIKDNLEKRKKILNLLQKADFSIDDMESKKIPFPQDFPESIKQMMSTNAKSGITNLIDTVFFSHKKFDSKNNQIGVERFNLGEESNGTQKFFAVLGPVIDTLENGKVLFIDEFDNSLHPLLTKFIIDLFERDNPNNAQLIVTTHDTSLLSYKEDFIKEQFWFTEKDKFGAGNLFSLAEFDLRNDTEYSKKYLEGRFGALPFIELL